MDSQREKIRVLVVDDHDLVRGGLISLLAQEDDIQVVAEASNGLDALDKVATFKPDVVLMDVRMPFMDGIETTSRIVQNFPHVRVLGVSQLDHEEYARRMLKAGAGGYVLKSRAAEDLKKAIRDVHATGRYSSAPVDADHTAEHAGETDVKEVSLTNREREVLRLVASGCSNQKIADTLAVGVKTIEFHMANLIEKIGSRDVDSLVRYAREHHIIGLDPGANHFEVEQQSR